MTRRIATLTCAVTLLLGLLTTQTALARVNNLAPLPADEQDLVLLSAIQHKAPERIRSLIENGAKVALDYDNVCLSYPPFYGKRYFGDSVAPLTVIQHLFQPGIDAPAWQGKLNDPDLLTLKPRVQDLQSGNGRGFTNPGVIAGWAIPTRCSGLFMAYAASLAGANPLFRNDLVLNDWNRLTKAADYQRLLEERDLWLRIFAEIDTATPAGDKFLYPAYASMLISGGSMNNDPFLVRPTSVQMALSRWFIEKYLEARPEIEKMRENRMPGKAAFEQILVQHVDRWNSFHNNNAFFDTRPINGAIDDPLVFLLIGIQNVLFERLSRYFLDDKVCPAGKTLRDVPPLDEFGLALTPAFMKDGSVPLPPLHPLSRPDDLRWAAPLNQLDQLGQTLSYYQFLRNQVDVPGLVNIALKKSLAQAQGGERRNAPNRTSITRKQYAGETMVLRLIRLYNRPPPAMNSQRPLALLLADLKNHGGEFAAQIDEEANTSARSLLIRGNPELFTEMLDNPGFSGVTVKRCVASSAD